MPCDRDTLIACAVQGYGNPYYFDQETFKKDIGVLFTIRKMARRFLVKGVINDKLFLNNIVIFINVFGIAKTNEIMKLFFEDDEMSIVKPCLIFLNCYIEELNDVESNEIIKDILVDVTRRYNLNPYGEQEND